MNLSAIAARIKTSKNLSDLLANLRSFKETLAKNTGVGEEFDLETTLRVYGIDICDLPTFGGNQPGDTMKIWSWDEDRILEVVGSFSEWKIRDHRGDER